MHSIARFLSITSLCLLIAHLLGGCSSLARQDITSQPDTEAHAQATRPDASELRWWRACFRMPFNADQQPNWSLDALLAEQVAAPSLKRHAEHIRLWRFHRRAAKDAVGHQFSLLFYSNSTTAQSMFAELWTHPLTTELLASGELDKLLIPCTSDKNQTAIEAGSDPRWDTRLQKAWPHFIMGVSAHWLALIEEVGRDLPHKGNESAELLKHYQRVHQEIDRIWRDHGQHAYLHHLNALFAYQPMLMRQ